MIGDMEQKNYLKDLLEYWIEDYDWKKTELEINSFPNFTCEINIPIHFNTQGLK